MTSGKLLAAATLIFVGAGFFAFTAPGHRVLGAMGFTAACSSDSGCD